jgi:glycine cleavage system H protein
MAGPKFTRTHEWVVVDGPIATVGITDHAQRALGDIVFLELPAPGTAVRQAEKLGTVESTKAAGEIYAPVSGDISEINAELPANPEWVNESPMDRGWMVRIRMSRPAELDALMDWPCYETFLADEAP